MHQYLSLKEIAEYIRDGLAKVSDFKDFLANICCEHYSKQEEHDRTISDIEQSWPKFHEQPRVEGKPAETQPTACPDAAPQWGSLRLGRLPEFVRDDCGSDYADFAQNADAETDEVGTELK